MSVAALRRIDDGIKRTVVDGETIEKGRCGRTLSTRCASVRFHPNPQRREWSAICLILHDVQARALSTASQSKNRECAILIDVFPISMSRVWLASAYALIAHHLEQTISWGQVLQCEGNDTTTATTPIARRSDEVLIRHSYSMVCVCVLDRDHTQFSYSFVAVFLFVCLYVCWLLPIIRNHHKLTDNAHKSNQFCRCTTWLGRWRARVQAQFCSAMYSVLMPIWGFFFLHPAEEDRCGRICVLHHLHGDDRQTKKARINITAAMKWQPHSILIHIDAGADDEYCSGLLPFAVDHLANWYSAQKSRRVVHNCPPGNWQPTSQLNRFIRFILSSLLVCVYLLDSIECDWSNTTQRQQCLVEAMFFCWSRLLCYSGNRDT